MAKEGVELYGIVEIHPREAEMPAGHSRLCREACDRKASERKGGGV